MHTSGKIYSFVLSHESGHIALTAQEYPWSVLQVVPATPETFDAVYAKCKARGGYVAIHDTDRTFCIIHLCSGDQDGKYPDRHITVDGQDTARKYLDALKDCMAQAAVWYYTNVVRRCSDGL